MIKKLIELFEYDDEMIWAFYLSLSISLFFALIIGLCAESFSLAIGVFIGVSFIVNLICLTELIDGAVISFLIQLIIAGIIFLCNWSLFWTPWIFLILLILTELLFLIDKEKPSENEDKFNFTAKKKLESFIDAVLFLMGLNAIGGLVIRLKDYWEIILKWIINIGVYAIAIAVIVGLLYLYIKLNSLKYKTNQSEESKE